MNRDGVVSVRRVAGVLFGVVTQLVFLGTLPSLFQFLHNDFAAQPEGSLLWDALLAAQFGIVHSLLLHPAIRGRLTRWVPPQFYGCLFCLATCAGLWIIFAGWHGSRIIVFAWPCPDLVRWAFLAAWVLLFYSLSLSGLGYQTGLLPWWCWVRGTRPPQRKFEIIGLYRVFRHPVYLSFLLLVWVTPVITADRLVLMGVWTVYTLIGSYLKDERLAYFLGETYRRYQRQVPGYPLLGHVPLGRRGDMAAANPISPG